MKFLSSIALEGIAAYKYKAGAYTWLDSKMTPFWNYIVEYLPLWMAPNLVTLIGTMITLVSTSILWYYSPRLYLEAPSWVYYQCAFSLFLYQALDAIDGKQARRTHTSSPLGQLFDHGCDALCTVFNMLTAAAALGFKASLYSYSALSIVGTTFYFAQWEEYHTGTMTCGNGYFGVTEAQFTLMFAHILTGKFGLSFWRYHLFNGYHVNHLLWIALFITNTILITTNIKNVFQRSCNDLLSNEDKGNKNITKRAACIQLLPPLFIVYAGYIWITEIDKENYIKYPIIYLFTIGILFVLLSTKMIVCHMCRIPFSFQWKLFGFIGLLLIVTNVFKIWFTDISYYSTFYVSCLFAMISLFIYLYYVIHIIKEICGQLKIKAFTIPYPMDHKNK